MMIEYKPQSKNKAFTPLLYRVPSKAKVKYMYPPCFRITLGKLDLKP